MACGLFNQPLRDFVPMVDRLKHAGRTPPNVVIEGQVKMEDLLHDQD